MIPDNSEPVKTDWDTLAEPSEEEKQYNSRELFLRGELESIIDRRTRDFSAVSDDYSKIFHSADHPFSKRFDDAFDAVAGSSNGAGKETLEDLFTYIDMKFPSPYKNPGEIIPDKDDYGRNRLNDAEDDYLRSSMREGGMLSENTDEIAKLFTIDGSQNDLHIAASLRGLSDNLSNYHTELARAIISYTNAPTKETRNRLTRTQSDHESSLSNALFNIAATFDESKTTIGRKLFEPTIVLATNLTRGSEDFFDGIMSYLKFKMENTDDEHRPKDDVDSDVDNSNAFNMQPDVFLR